MGNMIERTLAFLERLQHLYIETTETEAIKPFLDPHIWWIGVGEHCGEGIEDVLDMIREDRLTFSPPITVTDSVYHIQVIAPNLTAAVGDIIIEGYRDGTEPYRLPIRISAICLVNEHDILLKHYHLSVPREHIDGETLEVLRLSLERYQIIADQTTDIIFEWDARRDSLMFSRNWHKKFGYEPISSDVSVRLLTEGHIHPDDVVILHELIETTKQEGTYQEREFRIGNQEGDFIWCRVRITPQTGKKGQVVKAIGVIIDVDDEHRNTEKLKSQAERDTLTGLYNKGTLQILASRCIEEQVIGRITALMIIDVDDFKHVNDRYGHLAGDVVLSDIARAFKQMFRQSDIVGRIGGDEFAVLVRDCTLLDEVEKKAKRVLESIEAVANQQGFENNLSCSIGISKTPEDGISFMDLYKKADVALYFAKTQGKNRYAFYHPIMDSSGAARAYSEQRTTIGKAIDSDDRKGSVRSWLAEYVFQMLYQSVDFTTALPLILEIVGRQFDVSRVYVFEDAPDGSYSTNTYEWCNEATTPQKDNLQHVTYQEIGDYYQLFDENGIFYCKDVSRLPEPTRSLLMGQEIKSILQSAIRENGKNRGFVGFDECRSNRFWNQDQVNILVMISEIITVFLLKAKAQKQSAYMIEGLKHILDRQNQFIYVVEPETYRVLYANQKTCEVMGGLELGGQCHMYFFRRDTPCEGCPLVMLKEQETAQTELYSEVVKKTLIVDVSHITWLGHMSAYLVACSQKKSWEEDVDCFDADPYRCGVIDCFNEMVKAGVKRIAMAHPSKTRHERDLLLPFSRNICRKYKTNFYVEDDPLLTDLFPVSLNRNTYNLIFYRDSHWLDVYLNLKGRKQTLIDSNCYSGKARTQLALDFGALLSYPEEDCVEMIRQNREKES